MLVRRVADIVVDNCAICRNHIMDLCIECQANQVRPARRWLRPVPPRQRNNGRRSPRTRSRTRSRPLVLTWVAPVCMHVYAYACVCVRDRRARRARIVLSRGASATMHSTFTAYRGGSRRGPCVRCATASGSSRNTAGRMVACAQKSDPDQTHLFSFELDEPSACPFEAGHRMYTPLPPWNCLRSVSCRPRPIR